MKKLVKVVISITILFFVMMLLDLYIFRGFISNRVLYKIYSDKRLNRKTYLNTNFKFIVKKENNALNFELINKSIAPEFVIGYRYDIMQKVLDSTFFMNYMYCNLIPYYNKPDFSFHFNCGTDIDLTSVNPFESFKNTIKNDIILKYCSHYFMDRLRAQHKISHKNKPFDLEKIKFKPTDSIAIEFYIPLFSFNKFKRNYVVSNNVKLSSQDLKNSYLKEISID